MPCIRHPKSLHPVPTFSLYWHVIIGIHTEEIMITFTTSLSRPNIFTLIISHECLSQPKYNFEKHVLLATTAKALKNYPFVWWDMANAGHSICMEDGKKSCIFGSLLHMGPLDQIQAFGVGSKCIYYWSISLNQGLMFFHSCCLLCLQATFDGPMFLPIDVISCCH